MNADRILSGLEETAAFVRGDADARAFRVHPSVDVKAIRKRMTLIQAGFVQRYGVTLGAFRDWEQGCRQPEAAARILLKVIEKRPDAVEEALAEALQASDR
jgi:putative transcriptional regulator